MSDPKTIKMAYEIERKFLVKGEFRNEAENVIRIIQGYLSSVPERTVRVRIKGTRGFITVKGGGTISGVTRYEWEKEIPVAEAEDLLKLCEPGLIEKIRYEVRIADHVFEVDEFSGDNRGLIIAEIELKSEDELFERPVWLGDEVTGDRRYYNSVLKKKPFRKW